MRILTWPLERILQEVKVLDDRVKQVKHDTFKLCWHMRGGLTLDEAYAIDYMDREIIAKIIEENMKITKESKLPYF
jgi:hypothetical protein